MRILKLSEENGASINWVKLLVNTAHSFKLWNIKIVH